MRYEKHSKFHRFQKGKIILKKVLHRAADKLSPNKQVQSPFELHKLIILENDMISQKRKLLFYLFMAFACNYLDIMGTGKLAKLIQLMSKVVLLYSYDVDCFKLADNLFIFYFVIFGFLSLCEVANDKPQHFVFVSVLEIQQQISHQSYKLEKLGIMVSLVGGHPLYTQQKDWQSYPCLYYAHKRFSVGESQPFVLNVFIVSLAFLS